MEDIEFRPAHVDEKEQAFVDEVNRNREKEDEMLDQISKGLDELKNLGTDINNTLSYHNEMLKGVDEELQNVAAQFESGNQRLQNLLDAQGGPTRWLPRMCCLIILLAIVGYILKLVV